MPTACDPCPGYKSASAIRDLRRRSVTATTGAVNRPRRCYATGVITLLYFAAAREKAGLSSERLELPAGATVRELLDAVRQRHP